MPEVTEGLAELPQEARARLELFSRALERVHVDDFPLYALRAARGHDHGQSVAKAAVLTEEANLTAAIAAARAVVTDYIGRTYAGAQFRTGLVGLNTSPGLGPADDRVRVVRSLSEAITAIALGDALDEEDRAELLGAWGRLIP
jgi:hypothetical protein